MIGPLVMFEIGLKITAINCYNAILQVIMILAHFKTIKQLWTVTSTYQVGTKHVGTIWLEIGDLNSF